jgi:hypothetical protein
MIKVRIDGLDKTLAHIAGMGKQVRFATKNALNELAFKIRSDVSAGMSQDLDRPKPATSRAVRVEKATKENLTAIIRLNERGEGVPSAEFLKHNIIGGRRGMKRSEMMLQASGILPSGMYTIPGAAAKLDSYGNMSRGQIVSILSYFKTFGIARFGQDTRHRQGSRGGKKGDLINTSRMNRVRAAAVNYFVVMPGEKLPAGIWERTKARAKPVLMFVSPGNHRKLLKMYERGEKAVKRDWNRIFDKQFSQAMRSAR